MNESLQKEIIAKDREIQRLNKDVQQYEQTILNLRGELSLTKYHTPDVSKKDAEVMAGMCCTGTECGDWEPVKDVTELMKEETRQYQERLQKMEENLKNSTSNVHALRKVNILLAEEMRIMRHVNSILDQQTRNDMIRGQFKDEIIKHIRRQLKQAKAMARESALNSHEGSKTTAPTNEPNGLCVSVQPRFAAHAPFSGDSDPNPQGRWDAPTTPE
ncbi:hypothetical protein O3G_MSEX009078 [Manduca sexta]|uniref:Uncharacterized protein n=2 Tax=Manduca sexta TaxID=7130 RepID=A0A921ZDZ1_MANSE|nr:hypothetical protein O3G_MSEX009078 [Manduca sexta]